MTNGKRKVLVIGNVLRIRLPRIIKERAAPLIRPKLRIGKLNIPIVFILIAALLIFPIGLAFGAGEPDPLGRNLIDASNPANSLVDITNVEFHTGTPGSGTPPIGLEYPDGTSIQNGNFWLSFNWKMRNDVGPLLRGDYFDVILDLGLNELPAEVLEQEGTFAPVIYAPDMVTVIGSITWINQSVYQTQQRIVLRVAFTAAGFEELRGSTEDPVRGSAVWGYKYTAESGGGSSWEVIWSINTADGTFHGHVIIKPEPDPEQPPSGNENWNPYDKKRFGYEKFGTRLTPASTPVADTIFYWDMYINGHKHTSLEDWKACKLNCPPLPNNGTTFNETFTIVDSGVNISPTWLRNVTEAANGTPVIHPETALPVNRNAGLYGQTVGATTGSAYFKLFYVNSEYIWENRVDYTGSPYKTPANDENPTHQPSTDHPVGAYDPYYSTWTLQQGERNSLVFAPNYSGSGQKYYNYLTPVPASAIRSITLTENGFRMELVTSAVLGKTLAIGYMAKPVPGADGNYSSQVSNTLSIVDMNNNEPIVDASGQVLIGGTVQGSNKGKFIIEKRDHETMAVMPNVVFDISASSENEALAAAANALIAEKKAASDPPGTLKTGADGKLTIQLPQLPWTGGKPLILTVTETAPDGKRGLRPFTVTIEPVNGTVTSIDSQYSSDLTYLQLASDHYGVIAQNKDDETGDFYDAALRKWIKKVERMVDGVATTTFYRENVHWDNVHVMNGDKILYRIDLYNQCRNAITIPEVSDWPMTVGLRFDPEATMANNDPSQPDYNNDLWAWAEPEAGKPPRLEYVGDPIHLPAWDGTGYDYPEYRIPLILTVDLPEDWPDGKRLANIAEISKLCDEDGEEVEDIDSTPDDDPFNDGEVPCWDYGDEDTPEGTVKQHEIEEHRKGPDGEEDLTQDEDDHDFACVIVDNPTEIDCEVDKDTIRRTSAAFSGLPEHAGYNNVGIEAYRYDVAFRSTSSLPADEFTVDDPLENANHNQVRIQSLWTPIVWGDEDGYYNIWYKTNLTNDNTTYSNVKATADGVVQKWPNTGFKLWLEHQSTTVRQRLDVADLNLASNEYITAIRFEYGAVKVGFTSRNTPYYKQNGLHRAADGSLTLDPADLALISSYASNNNTSPLRGSQSGGNFFTRLLGSIFGGNKTEADAQVSAFADEPTPGDPPIVGADFLNWTPDPMRWDYAAGAAAAQGLKPAQYLVTAAKAMQTENIVASAEARIAKQDLWAMDVDAVVTRELVPFDGGADDTPLYTLENTYKDNIPRLTPTTEEGTGGRSARTFDQMNPLFWIAMAAVAAVGIFFLSFLVWLYRRRRIYATQAARRRTDQ